MNEQVVISLVKACGLKTGRIAIFSKKQLKEHNLEYNHGVIIWNSDEDYSILILWKIPFWSLLKQHCSYQCALIDGNCTMPCLDVTRDTSAKLAVKYLRYIFITPEVQQAFNREDKDETKRVIK